MGTRHFYAYEQGVLVDKYGIDIRTARACKAMISPTTAMQEALAKPFHLNRWLRKQLVEACDNNPRFASESLDDYYTRVDELSQGKSKEATDFGTAIHDAIEQPRGAMIKPELQPYVDYFWQWYDQNVDMDLGIEERVADKKIGIAGKSDRRVVMKDGTMAVLDVKTQGIKEKHYVSDSWCPQIAMYCEGFKDTLSLPELPRAINLIVNSLAPSPVIPVEWSRTELAEGYSIMRIAAWLFSTANNHWPVSKWALIPASAA